MSAWHLLTSAAVMAVHLAIPWQVLQTSGSPVRAGLSLAVELAAFPLASPSAASGGDSCTAKLWIVVNGVAHYKYTVVLDHFGRYPESHSGSARTRVQLYTCSGVFQYSATSPGLNYP